MHKLNFFDSFSRYPTISEWFVRKFLLLKWSLILNHLGRFDFECAILNKSYWRSSSTAFKSSPPEFVIKDYIDSQILPADDYLIDLAYPNESWMN